jgi:N6-adenosine-specific RNA methylase IME4
MIDPSWPWSNYTAALNPRQPEAKYKTMPLNQIAALPVKSLLRPGGVAWVWFTFPCIFHAVNIVHHAWGLRIQTGGGWGKRTKTGKLAMGTGHVIRGALEGFIIAQNGTGAGIRARSQRNLIETFGDQEVGGLRREHSRKPDEVYELIERLTPGWRRADVFSRYNRPGWDAFGDQVGLFNEKNRRNR